MNLAFHDIRRNAGRFAGTSVGIALLFTVVLAMAGIYQGLVDDATVLIRSVGADLWVVQRETRGPFADASRLDPSLERRVAAVAGVRRARSFTYHVLQRERAGRPLRFALVGLSFPGTSLPGSSLVAGRWGEQARGELVADASLGLSVGDDLSLAREQFRVTGLMRQVLGSGGDAVLLATLADAQQIVDNTDSETMMLERERRASRLRGTDLGRSTPVLESLLFDPRWRPPALPEAPVAAVLVELDTITRLPEVAAALAAWPDVAVFRREEQEQLLLDGVVDKPRRQLGLFSALLVLTSSVLIAAVIYAMTLDKTHDIAVLKLMGASPWRLAGMVLQEAWLMGAVGFGIAVAVGSEAFPHFPRRVVLTTGSIAMVGALVAVVSTLASLAGVIHALRVDPGKALEG
jgi:putative ABC transport system permease protein